MGPFGHFSIGMILGTVIILPLLKEKMLFDYDRQKWITFDWNISSKSNVERKFSIKPIVGEVSNSGNTSELNPISRSNFNRRIPIVAILSGLFALIPDLPVLWGNSNLDGSKFAEFFFFHRSIDYYFYKPNYTLGDSVIHELPLLLATIFFVFCLMAVSQEIQYNRNNYENCDV